MARARTTRRGTSGSVQCAREDGGAMLVVVDCSVSKTLFGIVFR